MNSTMFYLATNSTFMSLTTGEWTTTEFSMWDALLARASSWSFWVVVGVVTILVLRIRYSFRETDT